MSAPPPELAPAHLFADWRRMTVHDDDTVQHRVVNNAGEIAGSRVWSSDDAARAADDHLRFALMASAPALYAHLRAACMALRSYQYGNAATDLAASVADRGEHALKLARAGL